MADETKSPEILAIEKVADQVKDFNKKLGERADKTEVQEVKNLLEDLKKNIGKYSEKEIDAALDKINKNTEKMATQIGEMIEDVQKAKENKGARKSIILMDDADMQKQVKDMFPDIRTKTKGGMIHLEINKDIVLRTKAAEIMGYPQFFEGVDGVTTDWTALTGRVIDPRLYERKRKKNFILDNFSIPTIDAPTLVYLEKIEVSGDNASQEDSGGAAWITSGEQKPMRSFRVTSNKVEAKKIAIFGTVEDKLLRDVPSLRNWVQTDFTQEIRESYNDGLLNNDPGVDPDAPLGLKENAVQYSDVAGFIIADPNEIDAIIAAIAQLARNHEEAAYVAVSSDRYYMLFAMKDDQNRYQNANLIYVSSLGQLYVAGVPIIMADVEDVPSTHLLAVGVDGFQIRNYGPLVFEAGLNGEDFRHDRTSFRGYQEVLSYIPSHRYASVIYDTFSNIITAITS
jgi:HK97 family phage major capsid protein